MVTHPLTREAAEATGLLEGTPVSLGYVDMVMTALGAGVYAREPGVACSTVGSTGVHMRAVRSAGRVPQRRRDGLRHRLADPGRRHAGPDQHGRDAQHRLGAGPWRRSPRRVRRAAGEGRPRRRIEGWLARSEPGAILYHPYISAGERGPFIEPDARAGFIGLSSGHRYPDLVRAVVEGIAMAARDCYAAMGDMPRELRLTGGAARSRALRSVLAATTGAAVRASSRDEAGAAGAAMMAAVAIKAFPTMDACIETWVTPLLGPAEAPDAKLAARYAGTFDGYRQARQGLRPVWNHMAALRTREPRADAAAEPAELAIAAKPIRGFEAMSETKTVDVLVVGGGINGVGIARDAAGRGLSVVLCEKDDLAEGTSSRSGKLVHGGLRYLEYYEFRLVREALIEREVLLRSASHIIWPMRFVLPHSPEDRPAWLVRLGLFLYDHLGGRKKLPARARSTSCATRKARRSSTSIPRASNIPTAGWTTPDWSR